MPPRRQTVAQPKTKALKDTIKVKNQLKLKGQTQSTKGTIIKSQKAPCQVQIQICQNQLKFTMQLQIKRAQSIEAESSLIKLN